MQHSSYVSRGGQWNDTKNQANIHRVQDYLKSWRNNKIAKLLFPCISKKIVVIEIMEHNTCQEKTVWSYCQQGQHQPNYCMTHFCPKMQKVNVRKNTKFCASFQYSGYEITRYWGWSSSSEKTHRQLYCYFPVFYKSKWWFRTKLHLKN